MLAKLGIHPFALLAQIFNFLLLIYLLNKFLYKPLIEKLEERRENIKSIEKTKERLARKTERIMEREEEVLQDARRQADEVIQKAEDRANEKKQEILANAKKEAEKIKKQAMAEFEQEKEQALKEMRDKTASLVRTTTKQVLQDALGKKEQKALIDKALKDIKSI